MIVSDNMALEKNLGNEGVFQKAAKNPKQIGAKYEIHARINSYKSIPSTHNSFLYMHVGSCNGGIPLCFGKSDRCFLAQNRQYQNLIRARLKFLYGILLVNDKNLNFSNFFESFGVIALKIKKNNFKTVDNF